MLMEKVKLTPYLAPDPLSSNLCRRRARWCSATAQTWVEYRLEGVNQVQVHERSGLTFAAALRSILRQDPDVVMVGEIRDPETANIAIKASMTGHVVLSTLHTNDAPSALARLVDIGAEPGALAGALKGVVAQRLVRRLCPSCSQPGVIDGTTSLHELLDNIAAPLVENHGGQSAVDALLEELRTVAESPDSTPAPKLVHHVGSGDRSIATANGAGRAERTRVLIVEEHRGNRRTLRTQLEAAGFSVLEAADGEAALAYARRLRPDIVLTDIAMPKLDAAGLLQALAQDPHPPAVVVCTEQNDQELLLWLEELGAVEVMPAPLDAALLVRCLQSRLAGAA